MVGAFKAPKEGGENMTNTTMLKDKIQQSGLKKSHIAKELGMSRQTFSTYLDGKSEFRVNHMNILCNLLNIDLEQREAIFFASNGAFKAPAKT